MFTSFGAGTRDLAAIALGFFDLQAPGVGSLRDHAIALLAAHGDAAACFDDDGGGLPRQNGSLCHSQPLSYVSSMGSECRSTWTYSRPGTGFGRHPKRVIGRVILE